MVLVKKCVGRALLSVQVDTKCGIICSIQQRRSIEHMEKKLASLFDCIKQLCETDIDRIIQFVLGIVTVATNLPERPACPYCRNKRIIKFGHRNGKQRFICKDCGRTFMYSTNTIMQNSHYERSVWADFIKDTVTGVSLDKSAETFGFSHATAFNMRHKVLMAIQDSLDEHPVELSGIVELDETFVLESRKGTRFSESSGRSPRKHGAKAQKRGISNEYVAICTGVQRDGGVVAASVNRAKPSKIELESIFRAHIAEDTLLLTDGLRNYNVLSDIPGCSVKNVNEEVSKKVFNLNTVNGLHSFIKDAYEHYRGVATKYLNRYNALFSVTFRAAKELPSHLFDALSTTGCAATPHTCADVLAHNLLML